MNTRKIVSFALIWLLFLTAIAVASARIWTDRSGKYEVEAEFVDFRNGMVRLRKPDGTVVAVPLKAFSAADQRFVGGMFKARRVPDTQPTRPASGRYAVGAGGNVGCSDRPKTVQRLTIIEPGVYENLLVDGGWVARNLVQIKADDVTLRNCEIRNGCHNAVTVYAKNVLIENCKIHHMLAGTFKGQKDAHGITGTPHNLTIRNCEVYYVSGDAVQFDPDRNVWSDVLVENCTFWTGPLPMDAAGFRRGERPGENAVDTKQRPSNPRSRMTIKNCLMYGWGQGQIVNQAAVNLKNKVQVDVAGCVLADNDICFRLRGTTDSHTGALVTIRNCAVYRSKIAVRMEDAIENLRIENLGIGESIQRKYTTAGGKPQNLVNRGEFTAPPYPQAIKTGVQPTN